MFLRLKQDLGKVREEAMRFAVSKTRATDEKLLGMNLQNHKFVEEVGALR